MHKPTLIAALALAIIFPSPARPQADTKLHREVYESVNARAGKMKKSKATARAPGVEYDSELTGYSDSTGIRKIVALARDDDGDVEREYYFQDGKLLFVYQATKGFEGKKQVVRVEDRHYFRDGTMFKWLAGKEKVATPASDPTFAAVATELTAAAPAFVAALQGGGSKASAEVPPATGGQTKGGADAANGAEQRAVGKFKGVEQGDYMHFQIEYPNGTEDSFFVLTDENGLKQFCDKPDAFKGKQVEVRWVERDENIPEAGGTQRIRVAVGAKVLN